MGVPVGETTITGVGYADDTANLEESERGMENILHAFAKESAIGNRYKSENQRVLTFGINGKTKAKWKMGNTAKKGRSRKAKKIRTERAQSQDRSSMAP